jgi:hypothetical protein
MDNNIPRRRLLRSVAAGTIGTPLIASVTSANDEVVQMDGETNVFYHRRPYGGDPNSQENLTHHTTSIAYGGIDDSLQSDLQFHKFSVGGLGLNMWRYMSPYNCEDGDRCWSQWLFDDRAYAPQSIGFRIEVDHPDVHFQWGSCTAYPEDKCTTGVGIPEVPKSEATSDYEAVAELGLSLASGKALKRLLPARLGRDFISQLPIPGTSPTDFAKHTLKAMSPVGVAGGGGPYPGRHREFEIVYPVDDNDGIISNVLDGNLDGGLLDGTVNALSLNTNFLVGAPPDVDPTDFGLKVRTFQNQSNTPVSANRQMDEVGDFGATERFSMMDSGDVPIEM